MEYSFLQKLKLSLSASLLIVVTAWGLGELIMRLSFEHLGPPYNGKVKDEELGWRVKDNYKFETKNFADNKGGHYEVHVSFKNNGFRKWDERTAGAVAGSVFFVGDSYVECLESSDDKTFYAYFQDSVPVNIYACGCAGYGTVQEWLVTRRYLDTIKPKWVILETCSNDFIDNNWQLEMLSGYKTSQTRPYLNLKNEIEYHYPRPWYEHVKDYSLFLNFILERLRGSLIFFKLISGEAPMDEIKRQEDVSIKLTELAFLNLKRDVELKGAKLIVFILGNLSREKNEMDPILNICKKNNICAVTGAIESVEAHEALGEVTRSFDGYHFNHHGQAIVSEVLINYFRKNELNQ